MADIKWLAGEYAARKAGAEARVTQWVPYSDAAFEVEPLYGLRHRFRGGEPVEDAADALYIYGLDEDGRAWVERQAVQFEGQFYECFRVLGAGGDITELALYGYSPEKKPIRHQTFTYRNGLLVEGCFQATGGCGRLRCFYDNGRLVRIEEEHGVSLERLRPYARSFVHYDAAGQLSRLTQSYGEPAGDGLRGEVTIYRSWPPDLTLDEVERAFLDSLVDALPAAVSADPPPVRPACLWLQYAPGQFSVLPPMALFPVVEGDAGIVGLLNDAMFHEIVLDEERHPKLHELAGLLDQVPLDDSRVRVLMTEAAQRLNALNWASFLPVADDYFVFGADIEQEYLDDALREAVGEERASRLLGVVGP